MLQLYFGKRKERTIRIPTCQHKCLNTEHSAREVIVQDKNAEISTNDIQRDAFPDIFTTNVFSAASNTHFMHAFLIKSFIMEPECNQKLRDRSQISPRKPVSFKFCAHTHTHTHLIHNTVQII